MASARRCGVAAADLGMLLDGDEHPAADPERLLLGHVHHLPVIAPDSARLEPLNLCKHNQ